MHAEVEELTLPRGLIFLAFMWLVGAWAVSMGVTTPVIPSAAAYEPGVRMMLVVAMLGLMIAWPLYRLSGPRTGYPLQLVVLDFLVLMALTQIVLWPVRVLTTWTVSRVALLDATIAAWSLVAGGAILLGLVSSRHGVRTISMLLCVLACLGGPLLAWLVTPEQSRGSTLASLSPLTLVWTLASERGNVPTSEQWRATLIPLLAAGPVWLAAVGVLIAKRRNTGTTGDI